MNTPFILLAILTGVAALIVIGGLAPAMADAVRDASLKVTKALGNGAATVYSGSIDTGKVTTSGHQTGDVEYLLSAPAMNTTEMPDAKTMIYSVMTDTVDPIDGSSVVLMPSVITQTGAGGAGSAAATYRFRLPSTAPRLVGFRAVGSASGNATTASATLEVLA